jgi:hypothetical protein
MLAAECQSSNPYHVAIIIAMILMNGATIDLITSRSSKEPEVQNGRRAFWALSPLPWAFATAYRKIRGVAAPVPLPWAIGYAICAAAMLAAHFLGQASQVLP